MNKKIILILIFILAILSTITIFLFFKTPFNNPANIANLTNPNFTNPQLQQEQELAIKQQYQGFNSTNYTIENPDIVMNPYNINPLSAYIIFDYKIPVSYSYQVLGKDENTNFFYQNNDLNTTVIIPVIGLYENYNNQIDLTLYDENNNIVDKQTYFLQTNYIDDNYNPELSTYNDVNVKVYDETLALSALDGGFIFDPYYNGFDINGDIRFNFNNPTEFGFMKIIDGFVYLDSQDEHVIYKMDLMGKIHQSYQTPNANYTFHHDITVDNDGNLYALAGFDPSIENYPYTETMIFKYSDQSTPDQIWDYNQQFDDNLITAAGSQHGYEKDFTHFNSLEYLDAYNQLLVVSQTQSSFTGINADNGQILWQFEDPAINYENNAPLLEINNPETFIYPSGGHSAFITTNSKYQSYRNQGKITLSIFNNNNCKSNDGELQWKKQTEKQDPNLCQYNTSEVIIYALDLDNLTIETIDSFTINDDYQNIMSSVFDANNDLFTVTFSHFKYPIQYVVDTDGNVIMKTTFNHDGYGYYRTNIFNQNQIANSLNQNTKSY